MTLLLSPLTTPGCDVLRLAAMPGLGPLRNNHYIFTHFVTAPYAGNDTPPLRLFLYNGLPCDHEQQMVTPVWYFLSLMISLSLNTPCRPSLLTCILTSRSSFSRKAPEHMARWTTAAVLMK